MKHIYILFLVVTLLSCKKEKATTETKVITLTQELATLQEYVNLFPNKVVYIDIWASWCGPCLTEISYSIKLQQHYKKQNVLFLFLSIDKKRERWKAIIQAKQITGSHVLSNDQLIYDLEQTYQLKNIPRYLLFDKQGKLLSTNAPRPSSSSIKTTIDNNL